MDILIQSLPYLARGAVQTLWLSLATICGSLVVGVIAGTLSVMFGFWARALITTYVFLVRGIPVLVLIFLVYFALPGWGVRISDYSAVLAALIIYGGALVAEAVRGALLAVSLDQILSAQGIGMRRLQIVRHVMMPQAARTVIPTLMNIAVHLTKCTSFVSVVGVWELTLAAKEVVERTLAPFAILLGTMLFYYAICYPIAFAARRLDANLGSAQ